MKKILFLAIALLFIASFAWADDPTSGMSSYLVKSCQKPEPTKIYRTEYAGTVYFKVENRILTSLDSAKFWAGYNDELNAYTYRSCQKQLQERQKAKLEREANEDADQNNRWIEVK
jgi:hypothetical protein